MKKKIADKWVEALRSGKYKQGRHALKYKTKAGGVTRHCCLGVLCELYQKEHKKKLETVAVLGTEELKGCKVTKFGECKGELPKKVMSWSGVRTDDGLLHDDGLEFLPTLMVMNDYGKSFNEIADVIEDGYEAL